MSVTSPPRRPDTGDDRDLEERVAELEALIKEARARARRRRLVYVAVVLGAVAAGAAATVGIGGDGGAAGAHAAAMASAGDAAAVARSGGGRWGASHGPEGGPALAVAVAPSAPEIVYLGTGRGVFRSTNGGRSWTSAGLSRQPTNPLGSSLPGITSLAVDPRAPGTVYAGLNGRWDGGTTYGKAVFKSTNGGQTWRALDLKGQPVAISPTEPATVYAAAGGSGKQSRLFRSTDGGRSWQSADSGLPSTYLWALAFDPTTPTTVYAAMGARGVFESTDSGASWRAVGISVAHAEVTAIAVDPQYPQTVYAGADTGMIKSLDGGRSWRMANAAMGGHDRDRGYMQVSALLIDPRDSQTVYATTRCTGVFKSTDGGHRWSPANAGLEPKCPWAYSLALDPRAPQTLYTADSSFGGGVLKSVDGGARWHSTNAGLSLTWVSSLAVDPQRPQTVYASTDARGLFKSSDGGAHWRPLATGLNGAYGIALDPSSPGHLLAVGLGGGVVRSSDAGRTWIETHFGANPQVAKVAISGETAYASSWRGGLFGSTDGGRSWHGLPGFTFVQAFAIAPGDPAVVYASSIGSKTRGLYKSTDRGNSWQRLTGALDIDAYAIALDPQNPATVYVGTSGGEGGVFRSTDGGTSWQPASSGLPRWRVKDRAHPGKWITPTLSVTALAIDPTHPTTLYAATDGRGVSRSTDSGKSWHPFNTGLSVLRVTALAIDATGRTLYAGTAGGGVVGLRRNP